MLTERLRQRCPSARPKGVASVANWIFNFSKKSRHGCGMGTIERDPDSQLFGVVFEIDDQDRGRLDAAEGLGYGYDRDDTFLVHMHDSHEALNTTTYFANQAYRDVNLRPFDWYHALVLAGARQHGLPPDYICKIESNRPIPDPDPERPERLAALDLLKRLRVDV